MGLLVTPELWASLQAGASGHGVVRTRVAPAAPLDIFVAVEQPGDARLLMFGLANETEALSVDIPQASGISVQAIAAASDTAWGYAEVRLVDLRYVEVFSSLADDVIDHVIKARTSAEAIDRLGDRLRRWEAFLKTTDPDGLSQERRAGLYGELHVLRGRLIPLDLEGGVAAWVGPQGAQQDFQARGWAVEVKTSRTKQPVSVRISGERQLDDVGLAFLGLSHIGLEQRRSSGETLPAIVTSIRTLLANTRVAETFEAQLIGAGYLAIHEPRYELDGYTVQFDELFAVRDGFPEIIERNLPDGVGDVSYSVAIAALGVFQTTWAQVARFLNMTDTDVDAR